MIWLWQKVVKFQERERSKKKKIAVAPPSPRYLVMPCLGLPRGLGSLGTQGNPRGLDRLGT